MRRIRLQLRYDGTGFLGWQRQRTGSTIQAEVERAIADITQSPAPVYASGRTDAGVHALGQVAHFDSATTIPVESLPRALNARLPDAIAVASAEEVGETFHARYSARRKTYVYRVFVSPERDPLRERFALRVARRPDIQAMRAAARALVGEHDFRSFVTGASAQEAEGKSMVRRVTSLRVWVHGDSIAIIASASGFLQHMVRNIAGLLVRLGDPRGVVARPGTQRTGTQRTGTQRTGAPGTSSWPSREGTEGAIARAGEALAPGGSVLSEGAADLAAEILRARERGRAPAALPAAGLFLWRVDY